MSIFKWVVFIVIVFGVGLVLEIFALASDTPTLSQVVWTFHDKYPWVGYPMVFLAGLVAGHFFWPRKKFDV